MTVAELIAKLEKLPPTHLVAVLTYNGSSEEWLEVVSAEDTANMHVDDFERMYPQNDTPLGYEGHYVQIS